jgi:hypothetical protein
MLTGMHPVEEAYECYLYKAGEDGLITIIVVCFVLIVC